jgi:hypothetical protein
MKILVLGLSRSGKTEATKMLGEILGVKAVDSTSKFIIRDFAKANGLDPNEVLAQKETFRQRLFEYGLSRQKDDITYPVCEAIQEGDVVSGVRTKEQLDAVRPLFDKIIWINRPDAVATPSDNIKLVDAEPADIIQNGGTLQDLRAGLSEAVRQ